MNFHFTSFKLCTLDISLNHVTYLFSRESLRCKCNLSRFDFTCVFFLKILLFFSMLHYTVTYAFSLKENATSVFFIFTSLKNFNLHQFRGKILPEYVTYVLLPLIILYVPIEIFKNWSCKWKARTKYPQIIYKFFFSKICHWCLFVLKRQHITQFCLSMVCLSLDFGVFCYVFGLCFHNMVANIFCLDK